MTTVQVAVRLPADQLKRMDRLVRRLHASRSDVIRRALEMYLYRLECEHDARVYEGQPLTDAELALADDENAWSGTPTW
jgi:metal-responsive CopG/Arc/MetJ family transcriptional regulator